MEKDKYRWILKENEPFRFIEINLKHYKKYEDRIKEYRCFWISTFNTSDIVQIGTEHYEIFNNIFVKAKDKILFFDDLSKCFKHEKFNEYIEKHAIPYFLIQSEKFLRKPVFTFFRQKRRNSSFLYFNRKNKNKYLEIFKKFPPTTVGLVFCYESIEFKDKSNNDLSFYDLFISSDVIFGNYFGEGDFVIYIKKDQDYIINHIGEYVKKLNKEIY